VDESGCDRRGRFRRKGWAPRGAIPIRTASLQRRQRYQILSVYSQDGVVLSRVFQGRTDCAVFKDFSEQLLYDCNPWLGPNSVLILDNAPFHYSDKITQLCATAGVRLIYLPPYSPDLNPIEEYFSELKAFVRKGWKIHARNGGQQCHGEEKSKEC